MQLINSGSRSGFEFNSFSGCLKSDRKKERHFEIWGAKTQWFNLVRFVLTWVVVFPLVSVMEMLPP